MIKNFERILANTASSETTDPIAMAISGGPDSLALLILTHKWAKKYQKNLIALTVDHGLRSESSKEAHQVKIWATQRDIPHVTLEWKGSHFPTRLQEKARAARYGLLIEWCKEHQVSTLLLGHHQDDQEETFLLRLVGGSDLEGLSAMREARVQDGVTLLRPLLYETKDSLKTLLKHENQEWVEDPSNSSPQFFRGKLRQFLATEGCSPHRLSKTIEKLQESVDFIQQALDKAIDSFLSLHQEGYLTLEKEGIRSLHPALLKRLISFCMQWFSASPYPPRSATLEGVREKLKKGIPFTAGKIYWFQNAHTLCLCREKPFCQNPLWLRELTKPTLWDHRFWIDPDIKCFTPKEAYLSFFGGSAKKLPLLENAPLLPYRLSTVLPALWVKEELVAVPHLKYSRFLGQRNLSHFILVKDLARKSCV